MIVSPIAQISAGYRSGFEYRGRQTLNAPPLSLLRSSCRDVRFQVPKLPFTVEVYLREAPSEYCIQCRCAPLSPGQCCYSRTNASSINQVAASVVKLLIKLCPECGRGRGFSRWTSFPVLSVTPVTHTGRCARVGWNGERRRDTSEPGGVLEKHSGVRHCE